MSSDQHQLNKELYTACERGRVVEVKRLLSLGGDVNYYHYLDNNTPLHASAYNGHEDVVKLLLKQPAVNVDSRDMDGYTPLHECARNGHPAVAKLLLDAGASLSSVTNQIGQTPLHYCASNGHPAVAKLLLDAGASLSSVDNSGNSPLHYAADSGHVDTVEFLLQQGANVSLCDKDGDSPLHHAAYRGHLDIVKFLSHGANMSLQNKDGQTALDKARDGKNNRFVNKEAVERVVHYLESVERSGVIPPPPGVTAPHESQSASTTATPTTSTSPQQPTESQSASTTATPTTSTSPQQPTAYIDPNVAKTSLGVDVKMEITNVGTQGYPGVGKTSVLDLATGKDPAPTRTSTDCIDPPSRYLMIDSTTEGVEWENVTTDKMFKMVCEAMKKTIEENPPDLAESDNPTASQSTSDTDHELQASNSTPSVAEATPSPDSSYSGLTVFPKLLKKLSTSDSSGVIFNSHWMMVTDCGGQPPFLDAAALFLRNSCLQIFPVKLNEPLNKTPEFSYFYKGMRASLDEDCVPLTHKQIIETLAESVASIQPPYTPSATKCPKGVKFTIVGTFEDEAHKCSETVEEKESILKEVLAPYEPFRVQSGKKVILPVNAAAIDTETKKERTESAKKLRRLFKKANVSMKVDVKLRRFGFLLSLLTIAEDNHKAVLTLNECYKLGESLGMDKSETKEAIRFFHDISLIMHFDTPKLRDSVIIDTKPVLNKLSRIVSVSFLDEEFLADHYDIILPSEAKELLQYHGRFSRDTLEKCVQFTEPITLQFFLDVLEHVKIVIAIDKESEYFIPCALSSLPEASTSESSPHMWVIRLRVKRGSIKEYIPIPVGYLPAVVVFLLTEFSSLFSTDRRQRQYRNKIVLEDEHGGLISLVERHLHLEVHYSGLDEQCVTIRDHVLKSIHLTEEKLHLIQEGEGTITKVDSFRCSCDKDSAHFCAYKPSSGRVQCEKTGKLYELDPQHLFWLEATSEIVQQSSSASGITQQEQSTATADPLNKPPKIRELLNRVASRATDKWELVGLGLDIEQHQLNTISQSYSRNAIRCYSEVFSLWQRKADSPFTWTTIIDVLRSPIVEENALAQEIEDLLLRTADT